MQAENRARLIIEALDYAIRKRTEEEQQIAYTMRSAQLAAWIEVLRELRTEG